MRFEDMRVLVTGASGGIGKALVSRFIASGASVLMHGRSESALSAIKSAGCSYITGDLTIEKDRDALVEVAKQDGINVVVNNAGVGEFTMFDDSNIDRVIQTNVIAPMQFTQSMLPYLSSLPSALIVNVGSTFGSIGYPGYVSYCASKHAIKGFTEALRRELADGPIDVMYVSPRATRTSMNSSAADDANTALGVTTDTPEEVANAIVEAIKREVPRLQLGGMERLQVRANALFPKFVDGAIAKQLPTIKQYTN